MSHHPTVPAFDYLSSKTICHPLPTSVTSLGRALEPAATSMNTQRGIPSHLHRGERSPAAALTDQTVVPQEGSSSEGNAVSTSGFFVHPACKLACCSGHLETCLVLEIAQRGLASPWHRVRAGSLAGWLPVPCADTDL